MFNEIVAVLTALGALATAVAVFVAGWELRIAKAQARTAFEDDLSREYRAIIGELPGRAFYTTRSELLLDETTLRAFYRYVDLSNEQLFLARLGRSPATVQQWTDGICGNLTELPEFRAAWAEIADRAPPEFFKELKALVAPDNPPPTPGL